MHKTTQKKCNTQRKLPLTDLPRETTDHVYIHTPDIQTYQKMILKFVLLSHFFVFHNETILLYKNI